MSRVRRVEHHLRVKRRHGRKGDSSKRLGKDVIPENYNIRFSTNLETFVFYGYETIAVTIKGSMRSVLLNASKGLEVVRASVKKGDNVQPARISNAGEGFVRLDFGRAVAGSAAIELEFKGKNTDDLYGFYRSRYMLNGKEEYILTTQFEPCDARAAFPCFDEPEFKATFDISIGTADGLEAISNMPVKETVRMGDRKLFVFETTPRMSTYLVYLSVGKYEFYTDELDGLKLRVVTVPGKSKYAKTAMGFAKRFIKYYNDYFGIKYALPKLDLIAVPDFAYGAMENWGAIAFREIDILGAPGVSSVMFEEDIAEIVAHEIAHQWFGDLVTMKWWDDIWLNESFATFMSFKTMDRLFPKWKAMGWYTLGILSAGLDADEFKATHPVHVKTRTPGEIEGRIYPIVYYKGGSILSMMEDYVGPEVFRKGLHNYLKRFSYGNATKVDLWKEIQKESRKTGRNCRVESIAETWISAPGHPIISVKDGRGARLRQERFLLIDRSRSDERKWPVPIHYLVGGNKGKFVMLDGRRTQLPASEPELIKLNYGQKGFYRVAYTREMLERLGTLIKNGRLKDIDAWGVENDLFEFCRKGSISAREYLEFIREYCGDCGYPVDINILSHISWLSRMLYGTGLYGEVKEEGIAYAGRKLKRLGWKRNESEGRIDTGLREAVLRLLGALGDKETTRKALRMFEDFRKVGKSIDVNIRSPIYGIAALNGNEETFNWFVRRFKKETVPEEQRELLTALGSFEDRGIIKRALEFEMSDAVRKQDSFVISKWVGSGRVGKEVIWSWLRKNWESRMKRHNESTGMLSDFVGDLDMVSGKKELEEIRRFFADKTNIREDIKWDILRILERIQANINFLKRNGL